MEKLAGHFNGEKMKRKPIRLFEDRVRKEIERHKQELKRLKKLLQKQQEKCDHKWDYMVGTGNNDSYNYCIFCGSTD